MVRVRVNTRYTSTDGRRQRNALRDNVRRRKQGSHLSKRNPANIAIRWIVEHEVVPEHRTAGFQPAPHELGQAPAETRVEKGGEHGRLVHNVEGVGGNLQSAG